MLPELKPKIVFLVVYYAASRAQYVLNPWGADDVFKDGDEIGCGEDKKILIDEYKMSARHKKVNALCDDIFVRLILVALIFVSLLLVDEANLWLESSNPVVTNFKSFE